MGTTASVPEYAAGDVAPDVSCGDEPACSSSCVDLETNNCRNKGWEHNFLTYHHWYRGEQKHVGADAKRK